MKKFPSPTAFIDVLVTVTPGAEPGTYHVVTDPAVPVITQPDTVINYQIFDSAGHDIVFTGMTVEPADNGQLSVPSISVSGKLLTLSDANTEKVTMTIQLQFGENGSAARSLAAPRLAFRVDNDPQVQNDPQPH
jgi:hypothetical protein